MSYQVQKQNIVAPFFMGEVSAQQPVSGTKEINSTRAVHGSGRAAFIREETPTYRPTEQ